MKIQLTGTHLQIEDIVHEIGSIVEVDDATATSLLSRGVATLVESPIDHPASKGKKDKAE